MRDQFCEALHKLCKSRSSESPDIQWWFARTRIRPRRLDSFVDERTRPGSSPNASPELWRRLNFG